MLFVSGCSVTMRESIIKNDLDSVRAIIKSDVTAVNTPDESGVLPLHQAVRQGNIDIVKFLVEQGANVNITG